MTGTFLRLLKATSLASLVALALIPMTATAEKRECIGPPDTIPIGGIFYSGDSGTCFEPPGLQENSDQSIKVAGSQPAFVAAAGGPQAQFAIIPEPTPLALFGLGLAVLGLVRHRKRKAELKSMATDKLEQQTLH